ncbi:Pectinesterase inhibitor 7 [Linum grandiflorum]
MMSTSPTFLLLLYTFLLLFLKAISAANTDYIQSSCQASTRYPDLCISSLSPQASNITTPKLLASAAVLAALAAAKSTSKLIETRPSSWSARLRDCRGEVGDSVDRLRDSAKEMKGEVLSRFQVSNVQTWASAAMTCMDTCTDELVEGEVKKWVVERSGIVKAGFMISNALGFVNKYADGLVNN